MVLAILVAVLILNDFVLKPTFSNAVTGKLSDFVGVAALSLLGALLWPRRKFLILVMTALFFVYWKSPSAEVLISAANSVLPYTVGRVVDWWDLTALAILAPVWWLTRHLPRDRIPIRNGWQVAIVGISLFSFAATAETLPTEVSFRRAYSFPVSSDSLKQLLWTLPDSVSVSAADEQELYFGILIPWHCPHGLSADTRVLGTESRATLWLDRLWSYCNKDGWSNAQLQQLFQRKVVEPIRRQTGAP